MLERAIMLALFVCAIFVVAEVATEYHPAKLAAEAISEALSGCEQLGYSRDVCADTES